MLKTKFWSFSGKDEEGKSIRGIIDAQNKAIAHYFLLSVGLKKINYLILTLTSYKKIFGLNNKEKLQLLSHIGMQVNAGLSIFDSILSIKLDANSFKIKYILFLVLKNLNEGHRLSLSFEKLAYNPFSKMEVGLIKLAEVSGSLDSTLKFICEKLENNILLRQKLRSALIYPCITLAISFMVTLIIFKWVIPQFEIIFSQNKHALPWLTEFIFSLSRNINVIFFASLTAMFIFYIAIRLMIKYKQFPERLVEKILLKIPVVGKTMILTNRINFCYTLSILLGAGVSIHDALFETIESMTLPYFRGCMKQAFKELLLGKSLSSTLKKTRFFTHSAMQTIATAENTGRLDQAFKMIGQQFSNDLSVFSDHINKTIEPFIIILLGAIIGTIVIAIYLPIFQLGSLY